MAKRNVAKREDTHSCRSSNMNSHTYLYVEIYTVTYIMIDQWRAGICTDSSMFYSHALVCPDTLNMHQQMNTHVYTLTQKRMVQHKDMYSHSYT